MTHLEFEHMVRDAIRAEIARFDAVVDALGMPHLSVSVDYDHNRSDGLWHLYTYLNGISVEMRGAVLHDTMSRQIASVQAQTNATVLPSLIAGPSSSIPMSEDL